MREKLKIVFDTVVVLSFQFVFRVMHWTRRWNLLAPTRRQQKGGFS
jgi:hypothetical protein